MARTLARLFAVALLFASCGDDEGGNFDAAGIDAAGIDSGGGPTTFDVTLTTGAEMPVCAGAGALAMGTATITISEDETMVSVQLEFSGLSGAATAAHIHPGATGQTGPPILPFDNLVSPVTQTLTAADFTAPPAPDPPVDFAAAVAMMKAGTTYINVHTADCMPGEIRGQIE